MYMLFANPMTGLSGVVQKSVCVERFEKCRTSRAGIMSKETSAPRYIKRNFDANKMLHTVPCRRKVQTTSFETDRTPSGNRTLTLFISFTIAALSSHTQRTQYTWPCGAHGLSSRQRHCSHTLPRSVGCTLDLVSRRLPKNCLMLGKSDNTVVIEAVHAFTLLQQVQRFHLRCRDTAKLFGSGFDIRCKPSLSDM